MVGWNKHSLTGANGQSGLDTDSLPDRLVNSNEYEPLIPAVNQQGTAALQSEPCTVPARVPPMNTYGIAD